MKIPIDVYDIVDEVLNDEYDDYDWYDDDEYSNYGWYDDDNEEEEEELKALNNIMLNEGLEPIRVSEDFYNNVHDDVNNPYHYTSHGIETIDKIEAVTQGLPPREAVLLANIIKYVDRAGLKENAEKDLGKANNYAHRLVYGHWKTEH